MARRAPGFPMKKASSAKIAIIDNAIDTRTYNPVRHWSSFLSAAWVAFRAPDGNLPYRPDDFTHIILTGSEASILEREKWTDEEAAFVREAFGRGLSILGSCYGHQLLALALAGAIHVGKCPAAEVGWLPLKVVRTSPLLGPPRTVYAFSHHFDEVRDLQPPFEVLARSRACAVQAFGITGRNVWGLQWHPEIDIREAQAFMGKLIAAKAKNRELDAAALKSRPRDSGLIRRIVARFTAPETAGLSGKASRVDLFPS